MDGKSSNKDPLHGITLKVIVSKLHEKYGWEELGRRIKINCFISDPSLSSSLKFLRRTPWARQKVEALYLKTDWQATNPIWKTSKLHDKS
ncbi:MAG: VF530 family DNA-binding protein [Arenicella sp.]